MVAFLGTELSVRMTDSFVVCIAFIEIVDRDVGGVGHCFQMPNGQNEILVLGVKD